MSQILAEQKLFVIPVEAISLNLVKPGTEKEFVERVVTLIIQFALSSDPHFPQNAASTPSY